MRPADFAEVANQYAKSENDRMLFVTALIRRQTIDIINPFLRYKIDDPDKYWPLPGTREGDEGCDVSAITDTERKKQVKKLMEIHNG